MFHREEEVIVTAIAILEEPNPKPVGTRLISTLLGLDYRCSRQQRPDVKHSEMMKTK